MSLMIVGLGVKDKMLRVLNKHTAHQILQFALLVCFGQ